MSIRPLAFMILNLPFAEMAFGQVTIGPITAADPGFPITSEFGPRILDSGLPDFHTGIDYGAPAGTPAPLIEAGTISRLSFDGKLLQPTAGGILYFEFDSVTNHHYRYLHMFNNTPLPINSGGFTLTKTNGGNLCIVHWVAGQVGTVADYALAAVTPPEIPMIGGLPILDSGGQPITTTNIAQSPVGPVGTSGGVPAHFHVDLGVSENPLNFIAHAASNFNVEFFDANGNQRLNGFAVNANDPTTSFIDIHLDSSLGKDMESLSVYVDNANASNLVRTWSYGGWTPQHDPLNSDISSPSNCTNPVTFPGCNDLDPPVFSDGVHNGVLPNGVGQRDFIFTDWQAALASVSPSNLTEGQHYLIACWTNILNQTNCSSSVNFVIARTPPTLTVQDSYGTLPYYAVTTNNQISGTAVQTFAQVGKLNIFQNGNVSPIAGVAGLPASQATFNLGLTAPAWYWVQACDVVSNCALTAFCIDSTSGGFCQSGNVPPPPAAPNGGRQAAPPPIPSTFPRQCRFRVNQSVFSCRQIPRRV